jgi:DNA-binding NarL/FixJ family response regulator
VRLAYDLQPDAVVLDLRMPALDGLAVLLLLRRGVPGASLVVLSVTGDTSIRREAVRLGADFYLVKREVTALPDAVLACFGK